jgi:prolyl-tRNA synthetase
VWPLSIAPFSVILTPINYRDEMKTRADQLYDELRKAGFDVLLDDRAERPGVKFKDADLIGIPYRVVLGPDKLKQGKVELFCRATRQAEIVGIETLVSALNNRKDSMDSKSR